jgi:hypothetical protein
VPLGTPGGRVGVVEFLYVAILDGDGRGVYLVCAILEELNCTKEKQRQNVGHASDNWETVQSQRCGYYRCERSRVNAKRESGVKWIRNEICDRYAGGSSSRSVAASVKI